MVKLQLNFDCVSISLVDQIIENVKKLEEKHNLDDDSILLQIDLAQPFACME